MNSLNLGLKENWKQFTILVIVNAFVGGMIGMERSIFPQFAEDIFGVASKTAILSFITAFGLPKRSQTTLRVVWQINLAEKTCCFLDGLLPYLFPFY